MFCQKCGTQNELNSKFAISSSTEDLTANMTNTLI